MEHIHLNSHQEQSVGRCVRCGDTPAGGGVREGSALVVLKCLYRTRGEEGFRGQRSDDRWVCPRGEFTGPDVLTGECVCVL